MPAAAFKRNKAPRGYIDLRSAWDIVGRRMFAGEVPAAVLEAARANVAYAANPTPANIPKQSQIPSYPRSIDLIADAIQSGRLILFIYTESRSKAFSLPGITTREVLRRAGFFGLSRETIVMRLMDLYPRRILAGLDLPEIHKAQFDKFGLCLKEGALDSWLASTARQQSWPLDSKPRRGRGRPERVSLAKPLLKAFIDGGQWRQGMPLKELFHLINSKLKGEEVDRETIKKGLAQLYGETGRLEYRYVVKLLPSVTPPECGA